MGLLTQLLAAAGFLALFLLYKRRRPSTHNPHRKAKSAPEPAGAWPVLGHLPQLNSHATLARTLGALADKYGPVFTIRIGMTRALVVSNWEAVKECFTTNDRALASRPDSNAGQYLGYNSAGFGFAPYGPFWREMRKLVMLEVLSNRRLEMLRHVRISEIEIGIRGLFLAANKETPAEVVMSEWFEELTLNVIVRTITGKRYTDSEAGSKFGAKNFKKNESVSIKHQRRIIYQMDGFMPKFGRILYLSFFSLIAESYHSRIGHNINSFDMAPIPLTEQCARHETRPRRNRQKRWQREMGRRI